MHRDIWPTLCLEHPIDPIPKHQRLILWIDMDVGGACFRGVEQDLVYRSDYRLIPVLDLQVFCILIRFRCPCIQGLRTSDEHPQLLRVTHHRIDLLLQCLSKLIDCLQIKRILHSDGCDITKDKERERAQALRH